MAAPKRLAPLKPLGLKPVGQKGQQPKPSPTSKDVTLPVPPAAPGRPVSRLGDYLIMGDKMLNTTPDVMAAAEEKLQIKLPVHLRPLGLRDPKWHYTDRPTVMERGRKNKISREVTKSYRKGTP